NVVGPRGRTTGNRHGTEEEGTLVADLVAVAVLPGVVPAPQRVADRLEVLVRRRVDLVVGVGIAVGRLGSTAAAERTNGRHVGVDHVLAKRSGEIPSVIGAVRPLGRERTDREGAIARAREAWDGRVHAALDVVRGVDEERMVDAGLP